MQNLERTRLLNRLRTEVLHLAGKYGTVNYDTQDGTWIQLKRFPIGPGWSKPYIELLLDVPAGYPSVPPTWFWADYDLQTNLGTGINHFFSQGSSYADQQHLDKGWGHFCLHVTTWRPSSGLSITRGDSFLTYVELIRMVFYDRKTLGR